MDAQQFLTWLLSAGGYSAALAFISERIPAFQKLSTNNKQLFHLVGSLVIALAAYAALTYLPKETLEQAKPFFVIISGVIGTWMTGQFAHNSDPAASKTPEEVTLVSPHEPGDSSLPRDKNGDLRDVRTMDPAPKPSN